MRTGPAPPGPPSPVGSVSTPGVVRGRSTPETTTPAARPATIADRREESDTTVVTTVEPMHDGMWTERLIAGRTNQVDHLAQLVGTR